MISKLPYLFWLIVFVLIPSVLVWAFYWRYLKSYIKIFVVITICAIVWGLGFDLVGSTTWRIWSYSNTLNIYFLGLPIEEYLTLLFLPQQITAILLLLRRKIYG